MFETIKNIVVSILKVPPEPENPMGSSQCIKVFRPSIRYFNYTVAILLLKTIAGFIAVAAVYFAVLLKTGSKEPSLSLVLNILILAIAAAMIIKFIISLIILRLDYEMRWYKVSDRALRIREGILRVKELTMAFANIQNISVSQGPLQRLLGIADVKVECAGGGIKTDKSESRSEDNHIAYFKGIDNAPEIKELMITRLKKFRDSGLGIDHSPQAETHEKQDDSLVPILSDMRNEAACFRKTLEKLSPYIQL